jgi:Domain of unknown function (DUF4157)
MFAPPVKAPKTKTASQTAPTRAPQLLQHRFGSPVEGLSNQAMLQQRSQSAESLAAHKSGEPSQQEAEQVLGTGPGAAPSVSWDFSKIPVVAPYRVGQTGTPSSFVQPKLAIGQVNDPLEHEADHVADQVLHMPAPEVSVGPAPPQIDRIGSPPSVSTGNPHVQRCAGSCDNGKTEYLQTKRAGTTQALAPPIVHEVLRSPGRPLDSETRAFMEPRFGRDFSQVRLHTDQRAGQSALAINASAYTAGHHLVFGPNQYSPTASSSRRVIAHELVHFVQQRFAVNSPVLRRQPESTPVNTSERVQYHGHEGDDLGVKLVELADNGIRNSAFYKDAIRTSGPVEKRYVYRNPYALARLADILDLPSFDQCVALLDPDARGKVLAGMERIKKKYGLAEVSEDGAQWTENELAIVDRNFSKMKQEQDMLRGLRLIRKKEISTEKRRGKKFTIKGRTTGGSTIELTQSGLRDPYTILHEAGHLIQQKQPLVAMEALRASKTFTNMESARQKLNDATKEARKVTNTNPAFAMSLNHMADAVQALIDSPQDSVQDNRDRLSLAEGQADVDRINEHSKPWLDAHDRLKEYASAVEQWATEKQEIQRAPGDIEKSFVDIVKKYKLDTRAFAPFTDYVAHSWPDMPQEFLVQCYATWRANPGYMRSNAPKLFEWFESGGHLGISKPTK